MKHALVPPSKQSPKILNAAYADLASNILTHTVACCLVIVCMYNLLIDNSHRAGHVYNITVSRMRLSSIPPQNRNLLTVCHWFGIVRVCQMNLPALCNTA